MGSQKMYRWSGWQGSPEKVQVCKGQGGVVKKKA
jgi:hypothetical protein